MVPGPTTRSQNRISTVETSSESSFNGDVGAAPNIMVSEPPALGYPPPPEINDRDVSNSTQIRISMEMLSAQMRWVMDEIQELQRDRMRERREGGRPSYQEVPTTRGMLSREGEQISALAINTSFPRPPLLPNLHSPPLLPNPLTPPTGGFVFHPTPSAPLFTTTSPITFSAPVFAQGYADFPSQNYPLTHHPNNSTYSLKPRPDFPLFTGKEVHNWIYRVEQLLEYYDVPIEQKVRNAALYLDEGPLQWYRWWVKSRGGPPP